MLSLFYRVYHDDQFRQELRVRVLDDDPVAEIDFRTVSRRTDGLSLCKLHLHIPVSCIYISSTLDLAIQQRHSFLENYLLKPGFHI